MVITGEGTPGSFPELVRAPAEPGIHMPLLVSGEIVKPTPQKEEERQEQRFRRDTRELLRALGRTVVTVPGLWASRRTPPCSKQEEAHISRRIGRPSRRIGKDTAMLWVLCGLCRAFREDREAFQVFCVGLARPKGHAGRSRSSRNSHDVRGDVQREPAAAPSPRPQLGQDLRRGVGGFLLGGVEEDDFGSRTGARTCFVCRLHNQQVIELFEHGLSEWRKWSSLPRSRLVGSGLLG